MLPALDMPSQGILGQAAKYRTLSELLGSMSLHRGAAGVGVTGAGLSRAPRGHLRRILPGQRCAAILHILSGRRSLACGPTAANDGIPVRPGRRGVLPRGEHAQEQTKARSMGDTGMPGERCAYIATHGMHYCRT